MKKVVPRILTSRVKALTQTLKEVRHSELSTWLSTALELHDYQCNWPDPDMVLSNYRNEEETAKDIVLLIGELVRHVEKLKARVRWGSNTLEGLRNLGKWQGLVPPIGECSEEN
ncbi:PaREP1 family protein [Caldivirga sp.]|uniref:PaREP1 family protein n=1 Tax=Caldivirga sp. TaxID=2080243 RepID=UPI00345C2D12